MSASAIVEFDPGPFHRPEILMSRQRLLPFLRPPGCEDVWEDSPPAQQVRLVRLFAELTVAAATGEENDGAEPAVASGRRADLGDEREEGSHAAPCR